MHVIETAPIKPSHNEHYVVECNGSMKCSGLWEELSRRLHGHPTVSIVVVHENIVKSLLFNIDTPKDDHLVLYHYCGMPIARLRPNSSHLLYFMPVIRC